MRLRRFGQWVEAHSCLNCCAAGESHSTLFTLELTVVPTLPTASACWLQVAARERNCSGVTVRNAIPVLLCGSTTGPGGPAVGVELSCDRSPLTEEPRVEGVEPAGLAPRIRVDATPVPGPRHVRRA